MSGGSAERRTRRYQEHRPWQDLVAMLSVDEARDRILSTINPCTVQPVPLLDAHGLFLAEDVTAESPVPPFRNSAMDGYAVRVADIAGTSYETPVRLRVVAELPAGREPELSVGLGEAIRIMTGAAMPEGADTVVRFEDTDEYDGPGGRPELVAIRKAPKPGANVREAGEDIGEGESVLYAGQRIGAAEMGVLASVNLASVMAHRRPRVGILATGDEVVEPGGVLQPGQIRNSNNYMLAGLVNEAGAEPCVLGIAGDNVRDLRQKLRDTRDFDLLITSGGVSLGDYDVVKDVLQAEGHIDLWQVRIKPGKPMAYGDIGGVPLIGLPGNPVAAFVAFLQFGRPAILRLLGSDDYSMPTLRARLLVEHENRGYRRHYVRGTFRRAGEEFVVEPVAVQGSGVLTSITRANCLFVIPEDRNHAAPDTEVDIIPLRRYDFIG
jgi:molybdopterin molybdotransferase